MDHPGQKLKQVRETLGLRVRDVQEASETIARRHDNDKFVVLITSISEIENHGVVPNLHKLYSLAAIYRLDFDEVLSWYGIDRSELIADSQAAEVGRTHLAAFKPGEHGEVGMPLYLDPGIDLRRTTYLSRMIQRWGRVPLMLLQSMDPANQRYGFIGTEDWSMYPLLRPGSLVIIDDSRRKIVNSRWNNDFERPIWFLQHAEGYACGWCTLERDRLTLLPHSLSGKPPKSWPHPQEVRVIGQVTGLAMRLDPDGQRTPTAAADEP